MPIVNGGSGRSWYMPLAEQQVGEGDPEGVYVDQHVLLARHRLLDLPDLHVGGSGGGDDLGGAHGVIIRLIHRWPVSAESDGLETATRQPGLTIALASKCIGSV